MAQSIPTSVGHVIDNPRGRGAAHRDYKLDETPAGGRTTDLKRLGELTSNCVPALLADSTNADRPGRTPTEQFVTTTLEVLFAKAGASCCAGITHVLDQGGCFSGKPLIETNLV